MGGVVEELSHDLPPYPGIAAALDLDESGNAVLIQEEVVEGPARARVVRNAHLPGNQEPSSRRLGIDLVARQQPRMPGQKLLEIHLGGKRRLGHLREAAVRVEKEDASGHRVSLRRAYQRLCLVDRIHDRPSPFDIQHLHQIGVLEHISGELWVLDSVQALARLLPDCP